MVGPPVLRLQMDQQLELISVETEATVLRLDLIHVLTSILANGQANLVTSQTLIRQFVDDNSRFCAFENTRALLADAEGQVDSRIRMHTSVIMLVCVCIPCVYVCIYAHTSICVYTYIAALDLPPCMCQYDTRVSSHAHIYIFICVCVYVCIYTYICMSIYMCVCMYVYTCMCV